MFPPRRGGRSDANKGRKPKKNLVNSNENRKKKKEGLKGRTNEREGSEEGSTTLS
jgi:hypothetical protein